MVFAKLAKRRVESKLEAPVLSALSNGEVIVEKGTPANRRKR